jgi:uncharacterized protein (DUF433 family)
MSQRMTSPPTGIRRVVQDPQIQGGEPTVAGTRVTVASVVLAEREWGGVDGVRYAYPQLTAEQVADALAYYLEHQAEIDRYLQDNAAGGDAPAS